MVRRSVGWNWYHRRGVDMASNDTLRAAFMAAMAALERRLPGEADAEVLAQVRDAGLDLVDAHATSEALLEARDEQIAAQVDLLVHVELPLLLVRRDTLCVPMIGEFDGFRAAQIVQRLLTAAVERRVSTVVIDLTGALFRDVSSAVDLAGVFQALRLVGVRGVLAGVRPGLAALLAGVQESLREVPCYADLAEALADDRRRGA